MSKLSASEQKWLDDVQRVLEACPSDRLAFFTTGDCDVTVYDLSLRGTIDQALHMGVEHDFGPAAEKAGAVLGYLNFPNNVESTAG
ncbi:hypothetical protein [Serratia sp. 1D1416]|uniref:hypothetical protein n=1 Tax=Serratia sp. 1D1416 TaxID=2447890 RepID=UPI001013CB47|nr:hypothetical protein [Serratia sp. 1D1416]